MTPNRTCLARALLGCLLVLVAVLDARAACVTRHHADIPFEVAGRSILLSVLVNDIPATFVLDTGAQRSVVTREAVKRLDLALDEWVGTTMQGVGGVERHRNANPRTLTLGGVKLERRTMTRDTSFTVATLPRTSLGGRPIDGLLGRDFLSVFDLDIDVPGRMLRLYGVTDCTGRFLPWPGPYRSVPVSIPAENALVVPVTLDGRPLRALLDTGASQTLVAAPGLARLGVTEAALALDRADKVTGAGPRTVGMARHQFDSLRIGDETIARPVLWAAPIRLTPIVDMVLGFDWLEQKRVWISFASHQVFVMGP